MIFPNSHYDPTIGRWTSKDPILFKGGDLNLFGYAQNDPVNKIDTNGLMVYDPNGIIPTWIKNTPIYKQLDAALQFIFIRDKSGSSIIDAGQTNSYGPWGAVQTIDVDVTGGRANGQSQVCGGLTDLEDTFLHEFNHARENTKRFFQDGDNEDADNLLLNQLFLESLPYKK